MVVVERVADGVHDEHGGGGDGDVDGDGVDGVDGE